MRASVGYFNDAPERNPQRCVECGPRIPLMPANAAGPKSEEEHLGNYFSHEQREAREKSKHGWHDLECRDCRSEGDPECRSGCALSKRLRYLYRTIPDPDRYNKLAEFAANSFVKQ